MSQHEIGFYPPPVDETRTPPQPYPSYTRFYLGALGIGMATGITWTITMTTMSMQRHITKLHAIELVYGTAIFLLAAQLWMLVRWNKRWKRERAELDIKLQETAAYFSSHRWPPEVADDEDRQERR